MDQNSPYRCPQACLPWAGCCRINPFHTNTLTVEGLAASGGAPVVDIRCVDGQYLVALGKGTLLVFTKPEFIAALRRGKAYQRRQSLTARLADAEAAQLAALGHA